MPQDPEDIFVKHRDFFMTIREALLSIINGIELKLAISPTTSEIRREFKKKQLNQMDV
jgi:hypothetical protein